MSKLILDFLLSKVGISIMAIVLVLLVGGVQQLRINAYQAEVSELKLTLKVKENEAIDLQASIDNQSEKIEQLKLAGLNDKEAREKNILKLNFKHQQEFKKLNQGKGPGDLNRWLRQSLN